MDHLKGVLAKILKSSPSLRSGVEEAQILALWEDAVGKTIAKHAKATQLKGGTLFVSVDQAVWKQELIANKKLALSKLNQLLAERLGSPKGREVWVSDLYLLHQVQQKP